MPCVGHEWGVWLTGAGRARTRALTHTRMCVCISTTHPLTPTQPNTTQQTLVSVMQHFAAGIVLSAVATELLPAMSAQARFFVGWFVSQVDGGVCRHHIPYTRGIS